MAALCTCVKPAILFKLPASQDTQYSIFVKNRHSFSEHRPCTVQAPVVHVDLFFSQIKEL
jgi:hypothetical protein